MGHCGEGPTRHSSGRIRWAAGCDGVGATRVLWLGRHSLEVLLELVLPAPDVLKGSAPRVVARGGGGALLTVRSGPQSGNAPA